MVSYVGSKNLGEVQRSYNDGGGNTTVESFLYSYATGGDGVNRLGSVLSAAERKRGQNYLS